MWRGGDARCLRPRGDESENGSGCGCEEDRRLLGHRPQGEDDYSLYGCFLLVEGSCDGGVERG